VVFDESGKRECLADEPAAALAQRAEEPFDVVGQALLLACGGVPVHWDDALVGVPEVCADDRAVPVVVRQRVPQALGGPLRPVADHHGDDLPGGRVQRDPHPPDVPLGPYETPDVNQYSTLSRHVPPRTTSPNCC